MSALYSKTARVALAGFSALVSLLFLGWLSVTLQNNTHDIALSESELLSLVAQDEAAHILRAQAAGVEKEREELLSYVIAENTEASFVEELETLGRSAGVSVEITSIMLTQSSLHAEYLELLALTLDFSGSWSAVYEFVRIVETRPGTHLSSIQFEKESNGFWDGRITLTAFKLKDL